MNMHIFNEVCGAVHLARRECRPYLIGIRVLTISLP
jgi:hypothetical protein